MHIEKDRLNKIYEDLKEKVMELPNSQLFIVSDGDKPVFNSLHKVMIINFLYDHFKDHYTDLFVDCFNDEGYPTENGLEISYIEKLDKLQITTSKRD